MDEAVRRGVTGFRRKDGDMNLIEGRYATAKVFTDQVEETAAEQIKRLCDQEFARGARVRVMPDVHAGAGCVIGFTADLGEMVIPNIVGVDIGCGMLTVCLGKVDLDFAEVDRVVRARIPAGPRVHEGRVARFEELPELRCFHNLKDTRRIERSVGTLGGGNHFIEIDVDEGGDSYLVIHTGSRNLGTQVAEHYQGIAYDLACGKEELVLERERVIREYKEEGRRSEIQAKLKELDAAFRAAEPEVPAELTYLTGPWRERYLQDMAACQRYARLNRRTIAESILDGLFGKTVEDFDRFETVHNYIDHENGIVRKGAVSAQRGERLLVPINMRDGSLICTGKGNPDWNFSAPHGAGRLMSRAAAREQLSLSEFRRTMAGVWSTSVGQSTLDESPMAYKSMDAILGSIDPTAEVDAVIKPVYNFKAC